jgi:hypothetical protein
MLSEVISRLKAHLEEVPGKFSNFSEEEASYRPAPGKWCKKEILGHLIDSACNNHSRFVRAQFEQDPVKLIKYAPDEWVSSQNYYGEPIETIVNLWSAYNTHLLHIISVYPQDKLYTSWDINGEIYSTEWLITDYVDHLDHHLNQIFK